MRVTTVRISSKGQFTIPKDLHERLGMQAGEKVELWVEKGSLCVRPLKAVSTQPRRQL